MTLQPSRSRTSNEMKASTTNGSAEPTTEVKPVVVEELTTGQRIVEVLEKRIRNLEKRKVCQMTQFLDFPVFFKLL